MTDPDLARGYARAHVADAALWELLERMADNMDAMVAAAYRDADEIALLRAELDRLRVPEVNGTAYDEG